MLEKSIFFMIAFINQNSGRFWTPSDSHITRKSLTGIPKATTAAEHLTKVDKTILEGILEEMSPLSAQQGILLKLLIHDRIHTKGMIAKISIYIHVYININRYFCIWYFIYCVTLFAFHWKTKFKRGVFLGQQVGAHWKLHQFSNSKLEWQLWKSRTASKVFWVSMFTLCHTFKQLGS